ncbi:MAG: adenylate kinase [Candidatus Margulisiibacteriota bacterium]|nr:adenylate kinase [Candidatus Margulisiibacteriota bacterium]
MILIFLGAPGSGKGTQAKKLADRNGLPHIAVGDIFREAVRDESELGKLVKGYIEAGNLVPDEVTNRIVAERIGRRDCEVGFILDGYPRSSVQAAALDDVLAGKDFKVVYFSVPLETVVKRNVDRRSCKQCGAVFHLKHNPPKKENVCDRCGGELYQRKDDDPEVMKTRFEVYEKSTIPLLEHYKGKLIRIDANAGIDEVFGRLVTAIGGV